MKINELIGIKNTSFYKDLPNGGDRYDYDNPSDSLDSSVKHLVSQGWKILGVGSFAVVLTYPGKSYCLKIARFNHNMIDFYNYVRKNQSNPYLPKLYGKLIKLSKDIFAQRMEILSPLEHNDLRLKKYFDPNLVSQLRYGGPDIEDIFLDPNNEKYLVKHFPLLIKAFNDLSNIHAIDDLIGNQSNMMIRSDGTIVITDPFV